MIWKGARFYIILFFSFKSHIAPIFLLICNQFNLYYQEICILYCIIFKKCIHNFTHTNTVFGVNFLHTFLSLFFLSFCLFEYKSVISIVNKIEIKFDELRKKNSTSFFYFSDIRTKNIHRISRNSDPIILSEYTEIDIFCIFTDYDRDFEIGFLTE